MVQIQPVGASSRINWLNYADIGTGKTNLIGTGGKDFKILIMRPPIDHVDTIVGSGVQEAVVHNWEDTFEVLDMMRHAKPGEWDWFCIDSISLLQDIGLDDVYQGVLDRLGRPDSVAYKTRQNYGPDKGEYRVNMWRLAQFCRHTVAEGNFNFMVTAHPFWYEPDGLPAYMMPWIQGKNMPSKICGMMNIVSYMEVKEVKVRGQEQEARVLNWNKNERFYAKNQFKLPDGTSVFPTGVSINPTMPEIVAAINKGRPQVRGTRTATRPVRGRTQQAAAPVVRRRTRRT